MSLTRAGSQAAPAQGVGPDTQAPQAGARQVVDSSANGRKKKDSQTKQSSAEAKHLVRFKASRHAEFKPFKTVTGFKRQDSRQRNHVQLINQTSITDKHSKDELLGRLNKTDISLKGIKDKYLRSKNNFGSIFKKKKMSLKKNKKKVTSLEKRLFNRGNLINIYSKKQGRQKVLNQSKRKRKKKFITSKLKNASLSQLIQNQTSGSNQKRKSNITNESKDRQRKPKTSKPGKKPVKKVKKIMVNRRVNSKTSVDQNNLLKVKALVFQNSANPNKYGEFEQVIGSQFFVFNQRFLQIFDSNFLAGYIRDKIETVRESNATSDWDSFSFTCLKPDSNLPLKKLLEFVNNQIFALAHRNDDLDQFDLLLAQRPLGALVTHWICNRFYRVGPDSIDADIADFQILKMIQQNRVEGVCLNVIEASFDNDHLVFTALRCSFILYQMSNLPDDLAKMCFQPSAAKVERLLR